MRFIEAFFLREWQRTSAWQILLRPFALLFWLIVCIRRWSFVHGWRKSQRLSRPVVVVGNVTVGGTGKTPLVIALSAHLRSQGRMATIITRGSGGSEQRLVRRIGVGDADNALGDEARVLARRTQLPVYASIDRVAAGSLAVQENPSTAIVLSDDGLQHYRLARDIEVAVVDGIRGLGNGWLLPAGPLREPITRLNAVDCIVVNGTASSTPLAVSGSQSEAWLTPLEANAKALPPIFEMHYGEERFVSVRDGAERALVDLIEQSSRQRLVAVAGIGFPARFFAHLVSLGLRLNATHAFADHHQFQSADFHDITADVILMTEKDAVKCQAFADERFVEMRVDAILSEAFYEFIESRLAALDANGH
jgi:tetraacyldisaccharide 4'-kinase